MEHSPESIPETGVGVKISVTDLSIVRTVVDRFASRVNAVAVAWNLYQSKTVQTMGFTSGVGGITGSSLDTAAIAPLRSLKSH